MKVRCEEIVDAAFKCFCKELELIEPNSEDAYALAIFLNSCIETGRFQSLKYSALVHTPKARRVANVLYGSIVEPLWDKEVFNCISNMAHDKFRVSGLVHPDLCARG